jgi:hypothetical protein
MGQLLVELYVFLIASFLDVDCFLLSFSRKLILEPVNYFLQELKMDMCSICSATQIRHGFESD